MRRWLVTVISIGWSLWPSLCRAAETSMQTFVEEQVYALSASLEAAPACRASVPDVDWYYRNFNIGLHATANYTVGLLGIAVSLDLGLTFERPLPSGWVAFDHE